jgi:hypothetical protein
MPKRKRKRRRRPSARKLKQRKLVLQHITKTSKCAEIGVWTGTFSKTILKHQPKELHLVDPWIHQNYPKRLYSIPQSDMDRIYDSVKEGFKDNAEVYIHRGTSEAVVGAFEDEYFDWVYIDGNHSYEFVKQDLELWSKKIKSGGWLCGDDYDMPDVAKAVDEFSKTFLLKKNNTQFIIKL